MSKVSNPIHAVINTYGRRMTITDQNRKALYRFIWSVLKKHGCYLYRIGGIANHVHILFDLSPTVALSDLMRDIEKESSTWMRESGLFPAFDRWGKEYFAFGRDRERLHNVIEYIKNQPEHHLVKSFEDEMREWFGYAGVAWDDRVLS